MCHPGHKTCTIWPFPLLTPQTLLGSRLFFAKMSVSQPWVLPWALLAPWNVLPKCCHDSFFLPFESHLLEEGPLRYELHTSSPALPTPLPLRPSCALFSSRHSLENGLVYLLHLFPVWPPPPECQRHKDRTLSVLFCLFPELEQALAYGRASNIC